MIIAAVLAGGAGLRMGSAVPKQFIEIGAKPVMIHTLERFAGVGEIDGIVAAVSDGYTGHMRSLIKKYFPERDDIYVVCGGKSRGETLLRVLEFLDEKGIGEDDIILTHDAVRPFADSRMIRDNIAAAKKYGACTTCVPAVDTVFLSGDGFFMDSVPARRTVFHAQTPQSFNTRELYELCGKIPPEVFETLTDGCSVYTYFGKKVYMVSGSERNIKITYPDDIKKAEIFLKDE